MVINMKEDCLFCKLIKGEIDSKIIYEDDLVIACLDAYPNVSGHTLIIPKTHYTDFTELPGELYAHINKVAAKIGPMLMNKLEKKCITLGVNYGTSQAIKHYHLHIMPGFFEKNSTENIISRDEAYDIINGK
jgi:histidine triad (HIT) family protein